MCVGRRGGAVIESQPQNVTPFLRVSSLLVRGDTLKEQLVSLIRSVLGRAHRQSHVYPFLGCSKSDKSIMKSTSFFSLQKAASLL